LEKIRDLVQASPCKTVLVQKLARCKYVAYFWKHASLRDPVENIQPTDHGWKEVNRVFDQSGLLTFRYAMLSETMEPEDVIDNTS
jgi:hypothetical protein